MFHVMSSDGSNLIALVLFFVYLPFSLKMGKIILLLLFLLLLTN